MKGNYTQLTENVKARNNPDRLPTKAAFNEQIETISYNDVAIYIRYAMKGVDDEYTSKSKSAGENVKSHLDKELEEISFKYQGSVMSNTHIQGHSDIDLLVISEKFYSWNSLETTKYLTESTLRNTLNILQVGRLEKERNNGAYTGDSLEDLRLVRINSEIVLKSIYNICNVKNPKSIKIRNQNFNRDVDISVANWYDDVSSIINDKGEYRGIQIYNKDTRQKENADYPFLSIKRLNERGDSTNSRLRKMIRFLKNVKKDSDFNIELNSFDFNAICYNINVSDYSNQTFLSLVSVIYNQLRKIESNEDYANKIISVDGKEYIFKSNPEKLRNLKLLLTEVGAINNDYLNSIKLI